MHCIICGNETNGCVCPRCGFDLSTCAEQYPTLCLTQQSCDPLWKRRNAMYTAAAQLSSRLTAPEESPQDLFLTMTTADRSCVIYGLTNKATGLIGPPVSILNVPSTIQEMTVTGIGAFALKGRVHLLSVFLPETVRYIGTFAFHGCDHLQKVQLPSSISIGKNAFSGCSELETVEFYSPGRSISSEEEDGNIAEFAFHGCSPWLTFLAAPDSKQAAYAMANGIRVRFK